MLDGYATVYPSMDDLIQHEKERFKMADFKRAYTDLMDCLDELENRSCDDKKRASQILKEVALFMLDEGIIENYDTEAITKLMKECK